MDEKNMDITAESNLPSVSNVTVEPYEEKPLSGFIEEIKENGLSDDASEISEPDTADPGVPEDPDISYEPDPSEKMEGSDEPEESGEPEEPGKPEEPGEPEESGEPEEPGGPEKSDEPEESGEPDEPDHPDTPANPDDPDNPGNSDEPEIKPPSKPVLILIAVVIVLGIVAAFVITWLNKERNKPALKVEEFLEYAKELDFEGMQSCLKSGDISVLDGTDLTDETYDSFFRSMSEQITYDIARVRIHHQDGTAQVTAHIKYVDASQNYAQTVTEFLSEYVNATFGENDPENEEESPEEPEALTDDTSESSSESGQKDKSKPQFPDTESEEVQETLSRLLMQKAEENETVFSEMEIMYPMILEDKEWKIVSLDNQTVRVLAGNSSGIENEIRNAVAGIDPDAEGDGSGQDPEMEPAALEIDAESYTIKYTGHEVGTDFAGEPCLKLFYDYTNLSEFPSSPLRDVRLLVFQHGKRCQPAIPAENRNDIDSFYDEAEEGETIPVCQIFSLEDLSSVMIQIDGDGKVSETLTLLLEEEEE